MRGSHIIRRLQPVASITLLLLAALGAPAEAAPFYQVTDLGAWDNPVNALVASTPDPGMIVYGAASRPIRIDNAGSVSSDRLNTEIFDAATLNAIQAPYERGFAGLFPSGNGAPYQAGFVASTEPNSPWQAMIWDGQAGRALGPVPSPTAWAQYNLQGSPDSGWFSLAFGVNGQGHAVGSVGNGISNRAAVTWGMTPAGGTDPLDAVRSQLGSYSEAFGINSQNQVVGTFKSFADPRAFLLDGPDLIDLNSTLEDNKGLTLRAATGINDKGQIVGIATDADGMGHKFLLTPALGNPQETPEPGTLAVFGLMAVAFASARSKRWIAGLAQG